MYKGHRIVTLCGSTKFKEDFMRIQGELALQGNIVLSVGVFSQSGNDFILPENFEEDQIALHKLKIEMSDAIYVINKGGYIGENTLTEIIYATMFNKEVMYMEPVSTWIQESLKKNRACLLETLGIDGDLEIAFDQASIMEMLGMNGYAEFQWPEVDDKKEYRCIPLLSPSTIPTDIGVGCLVNKVYDTMKGQLDEDN